MMLDQKKLDYAVFKVELTQKLLNEYQHNFPVSSAPYAEIADKLGVSEVTVLNLLKELEDKNILSRVGAVFRPNRVGVSTLAAMMVPKHKLEDIAAIISSYSAVNHNYEREHPFNLWFVVTAENLERLSEIINEMEQKTHIKIMSLPMEKDYHIDLGFPLNLMDKFLHD